jgi:predicted DNA-binding antitoxin AbrB/MazE fold protein
MRLDFGTIAIMTTIEAIYENGVFKPVEPVVLPEKERVRLQVEVLSPDGRAWFAEMRESRARLQEKYGAYPDSTKDIAEDRRRDV